MKWLVGIIIICSSLLSDVIVIASDDEVLSSNISSKASRSNYYILVDEKGTTLEILNNSFKNIKGGASSELIKMLKNKKASYFIAAGIGDKLENELNTNNIKYKIYKGSINIFIESLNELD